MRLVQENEGTGICDVVRPTERSNGGDNALVARLHLLVLSEEAQRTKRAEETCACMQHVQRVAALVCVARTALHVWARLRAQQQTPTAASSSNYVQ